MPSVLPSEAYTRFFLSWTDFIFEGILWNKNIFIRGKFAAEGQEQQILPLRQKKKEGMGIRPYHIYVRPLRPPLDFFSSGAETIYLEFYQ